MRRHVRIPVSVVQTSKSHVKAASAKARSRSACAGLLSELFLGRDTKVIAIDCKNRGWTGFPRSTRSSTMVYPGSSIDVRHMPRIIAGAFAGTARSTCRVPRQNLGHRESAGWPVSVRALFLFYLKNYHLHRRKSFHDKDTIRSLRGARNRLSDATGGNGRRGCACARLEGLPDPTDSQLVRPARAAPPGPWRGKTGDHAGPDRCLGTNSRTRSTPRRISDLPIEFRSSGRGFTQDLRAKNQRTAGDTSGSSLTWDISRHSSDLQRRLAGAPPGLLGCDGHHEEPAHAIRSRGAHRTGRTHHLPER